MPHNSSQSTNAILVGRIMGAHGIKGEVRLKSFTTNPADIASLQPLHNAQGSTFKMNRMRAQKDDFIVLFHGITDRNQAEALRGTDLFVARSQLPQLGPSQLYAHDIIGQMVQLEDGTELGRLIAIANYGASDLLEIERPNGKDTLLIPFTNQFVPQDDFTTGHITVILPEGYLDEAIAEDELQP